MKYRVFIEQDEEGVFVAEVPSLPGCISQGATRAENFKQYTKQGWGLIFSSPTTVTSSARFPPGQYSLSIYEDDELKQESNTGYFSVVKQGE